MKGILEFQGNFSLAMVCLIVLSCLHKLPYGPFLGPCLLVLSVAELPRIHPAKIAYICTR